MTSNKFKKLILILMTLPLTNYINAAGSTTLSAVGNNTNSESSMSKPVTAAARANVPSNNNKVSSTTSPITSSTANSKNSPAPKTVKNTANIDDSNDKTNNVPTLSPDKVVLNFENADIQTVIKAISQLSGKNFVIDPRVKGTVNIVSDQPVSKVDSYKVLEAALRMQGFASVEADGVIKVLPETDAKTYGMKTETSSNGGNVSSKHQLGDQVITKIFVIQHGSATQLANSLRPLIAPNNSISVYPNSNALIVTDYASNLNRIGQLIDQLSAVNNGRPTEPMIITMQHAVAADVAQILQSYLNGGGSAPAGGGGNSGNTDGPSTTITVEPTTNSIILYSPIQDKLNELKALAMKIDSNIGNVHNDLHVVYLKNAEANHVADVLRSVVSQQENPDLTASASYAKFAAEPTAVFGSTGGSGSGSGAPSSGGGMSAARQSSSTNRGGAGQNANNANKDAPKILVQAEPTTNSLIIQAPTAVYKNLRMIIDMLDVRRAQVMIETMIANINATENGTFGIQWVLGGGNNNLGAIGISNYGGNGSSLSGLATSVIGATSAASGSGTTTSGISIPNEVYVGLVTGTTTVGGQTIPGLSVLADMLTANSLGNVLSRPTLITLDNEEARIMVGSNIGIPNGSYQNTAANAGNLVTTITRQDLGTALQIKPTITQNGAIQLDIFQEDSKLDPNQVPNNPNGPSFLKQNMRATLLVDDGQIIAIGGMTTDQVSLTTNGVPLLSSIPYLGWLFSWQSRQHIKSNVVLFLRPAIIRNADGYKALTNQRYSYIMDQQNAVQAKGNLVLPEIKPVNLDNQVPYSLKSAPGNSNPSLNMNQNLPIVDLTNNGANINKSNPSAISSTTTVVKPTPPSSLNTLPAASPLPSVESSSSTINDNSSMNTAPASPVTTAPAPTGTITEVKSLSDNTNMVTPTSVSDSSNSEPVNLATVGR